MNCNKTYSAFLAFVIFSLFSFQILAQNVLAQNAPLPELRGLKEIPMDEWTQFLFKSSPSPNRATKLLLTIDDRIKTWTEQPIGNPELFKNIMNFVKETDVSNAKQFKILAYQLLATREALRTNSNNKIHADLLRERLYFLETLAEEVLFVGFQKWSSEMSFNPKNSSKDDFAIYLQDYTDLHNPQRMAKVGDFTLETGDLVLSKSTGNGSSFFISSIAQEPTIYSHSALAWMDPQRSWTFATLVEALMEDGTKLRQLNWLEYSKKTRLFIYRYRGSHQPDAYQEITARTDAFVDAMKSRVSDPYKEAAYGYDISMDPYRWQNERYFCSAVSWKIFEAPSSLPNLNPYPQSHWSQVGAGRKVLLKTLEINQQSFPAPGDAELNPNWSLVGLKIKLSNLAQERIEAAIVESFLELVEQNQQSMQKLEQALDHIGEDPLSREDLKTISMGPRIPEKYRQMIAAHINEVPENANAKELAFFYFLKEVRTPQLRAELLKSQEEALKQGKILGPQQLRRQAFAKVRIVAKAFQEKLLIWLQFLDTQKNLSLEKTALKGGISSECKPLLSSS